MRQHHQSSARRRPWKLDDRCGSGVAQLGGVGLDWSVDVADGVLVLVGAGLGIRVAVAVASSVGVVVTVGVGVRIGMTAMTVALVQSATSLPLASCPAEQALLSHWPGSVTVAEATSVVDAPAARPSLNAQATNPVSASIAPPPEEKAAAASSFVTQGYPAAMLCGGAHMVWLTLAVGAPMRPPAYVPSPQTPGSLPA
jgi:hypothetical protein